MTKPLLSLSLDLDNLWSYQKVHGDPGWDRYPSYLDEVVPRVLDSMAAFGLPLTVFVVGQDAARPENRTALRRLAGAGFEIANHSFNHEPWLHLYSRDEIDKEIESAENVIADVTGQRPRGFRGPGFSLSDDVLRVLADRDYLYDCSTLPTFIGPLARLYYFRTSRNLSGAAKDQRAQLFGSWRDALRPLKPYRWTDGERSLIEIPVTTMPLLRAPIHMSYLLYLAGYSPAVARLYLNTAITSCRLTGVEPSFLLHPLDFMSGDTVPALAFFPGMQLSTSFKLEWMRDTLKYLTERFTIVTMATHANAVADRLPARLQVAH